MLVELERRRAPDAGTAFDRLFCREYPRVVAVARRLLFDTASAEDVAQDVFVQFLRSQDPDAPFAAAWLHRAAVHRALNALRGARRRTRRESSSTALEAPLSDACDADPLRSALRAEERRAVRAVLARLPERSKAVLALRHSGLSYAETAAALGIKTNHVGTLLARAEAAFTKEMHRALSR